MQVQIFPLACSWKLAQKPKKLYHDNVLICIFVEKIVPLSKASYENR